MCHGCWEEYGRPTVRTEKVLRSVELIEAVYDESCAGGGMHVQLDDWNIEDEFFGAESEGYLKTEAERRCFALMREMSVEERASALALKCGYFDDAPAVPAC